MNELDDISRSVINVVWDYVYNPNSVKIDKTNKSQQLWNFIMNNILDNIKNQCKFVFINNFKNESLQIYNRVKNNFIKDIL